MQETNIEKLVERAKQLQRTGEKWHFHMLTPDCQFNSTPNKHLFVLEEESSDETLVVYSDHRYLKVGEELVKLIYGDAIVEEKGIKREMVRPQIVSQILEKATQCNRRGIIWHHHLLFPKCIFNNHKKKWINVFEFNGEKIESITDYEPIEDLGEIEKLFYAQKK